MNRTVNHDLREHRVSAVRQLAMFAFEPSASVRAISIVNQHGTNARQVVADAIVAAIRTGDLGKVFDVLPAFSSKLSESVPAL